MNETWAKLINIDINSFKNEEIQMIPVEKIRLNPFQPRKIFASEKIDELAQSIKTYGLLQPVIVRRFRDEYQLVAGERRLRACTSLKWTSIPAVVRELSDSAMATVALIENLQRENLHYLEEAQGYQKLLQTFNLTQEVLAQRLGKSQSTIANKLRLLKLPDEVQKKLYAEEVTERHARALLRLPDEKTQHMIIDEIIQKKLTVKQAEKRIEDCLARLAARESREKRKVIVRDLRIFLNTIRQAVGILQKAGLNPTVREEEFEDHVQVTICLPKRPASTSGAQSH